MRRSVHLTGPGDPGRVRRHPWIKTHPGPRSLRDQDQGEEPSALSERSAWPVQPRGLVVRPKENRSNMSRTTAVAYLTRSSASGQSWRRMASGSACGALRPRRRIVPPLCSSSLRSRRRAPSRSPISSVHHEHESRGRHQRCPDERRLLPRPAPQVSGGVSHRVTDVDHAVVESSVV